MRPGVEISLTPGFPLSDPFRWPQDLFMIVQLRISRASWLPFTSKFNTAGYYFYAATLVLSGKNRVKTF